MPAIAYVEFAEDDGNVVPYGVRAQHELPADIGLPVAVGDDLQYVPLSVGQVGKFPRGLALTGEAKLVEHVRRGRWAEDRLVRPRPVGSLCRLGQLDQRERQGEDGDQVDESARTKVKATTCSLVLAVWRDLLEVRTHSRLAVPGSQADVTAIPISVTSLATGGIAQPDKCRGRFERRRRSRLRPWWGPMSVATPEKFPTA